MHNILNCKYDNIPNLLIMRYIEKYATEVWKILPLI